MNIEQIKYLVAVAEMQSVKSASSKLFVTPQAVSKGLRTLERELSISILANDESSNLLTKDAMKLLPAAKAMLDAEQLIRETAAQKTSGSSERAFTIAVSSSAMFGSILDESRICNIREALREYEVRTIRLAEDSCPIAVQNGTADVAFTYNGDACAALRSMTAISIIPKVVFYDDDIGLEKRISLESLQSYKIGCPESHAHHIERLRAWLKIAKQNPENVSVVSDSPEWARQHLRNRGIFFVANNPSPLLVAGMTIAVVDVDEHLNIPVNLVYKDRPNDAVRKLRNLILDNRLLELASPTAD